MGRTINNHGESIMKITAITPEQQDVSSLGKNSASTTGASFQDILARELAVAKSQATPATAATSAAG